MGSRLKLILSSYIYLYIIVYCLTLFIFFCSLQRRLPSVFFARASFIFLLQFIELFDSTLKLALYLLLFLSGVPPFFLFFIKFNLFIFICLNLNVYVLGYVYVILFSGTLYYLQIFSNKNKSLKLFNYFNSFISFFKSFTLFISILNKGTLLDYYLVLRIIYLFIFSILSYFFFLDFYYFIVLII